MSVPYIHVKSLGGGCWSAIPVTPDGIERECLAHPEGGVLMSREAAESVAKPYAQLKGWKIVIDVGE